MKMYLKIRQVQKQYKWQIFSIFYTALFWNKGWDFTGLIFGEGKAQKEVRESRAGNARQLYLRREGRIG